MRSHPALRDRPRLAYEMRRDLRLPWDEISARLGYSTHGPSCVAHRMARAHAERRDLPWPVEVPPPDRAARTRAAHEARAAGGVAWPLVARHLDYASDKSALRSVRDYAAKRGLPWPVPRPRLWWSRERDAALEFVSRDAALAAAEHHSGTHVRPSPPDRAAVSGYVVARGLGPDSWWLIEDDR